MYIDSPTSIGMHRLIINYQNYTQCSKMSNSGPIRGIPAFLIIEYMYNYTKSKHQKTIPNQAY